MPATSFNTKGRTTQDSKTKAINRLKSQESKKIPHLPLSDFNFIASRQNAIKNIHRLVEEYNDSCTTDSDKKPLDWEVMTHAVRAGDLSAAIQLKNKCNYNASDYEATMLAFFFEANRRSKTRGACI